MQALPSIEVLGFLNWLSIEGYSEEKIGVPLDILFTEPDEEYMYTARRLAKSYLALQNFEKIGTCEQSAEVIVDGFTAVLRNKAVEQIKRNFYQPDDLSKVLWAIREAFEDTWYSVQKIREHRDYRPGGLQHRIVGGNTRPAKRINEEDLTESLRFYLTHYSDPVISAWILNNPENIAYTAISFLKWASERNKIKNCQIRNIPNDVFESFISDYVWAKYKKDGYSEYECKALAEKLRQVFVQHKYDDYLSNIFSESDFEKVVGRMFHRHVRFKCTLLAEGNTLSRFVREYWKELNEYSADHLDIFYNEEELTRRGVTTADKLGIRNKVTAYPSIYLWEYRLSEGYAVSVANLEEGDLRDAFRAMVDMIIDGKKLESIASELSELISDMYHAKCSRVDEERKLSDAILNACRELQNQRIWHQKEGKSENSRNTYIAPLIERVDFIAKDQTLGGRSSTGISIGENDIKIYRKQEPIAIIEALNLPAFHAQDWDHKNFREHVNRIYGYDTNGLSRNYLLIYADTPMFDSYWKSILKEFTVTNKCKFGDATFVDVTDLPEQSNTDLRIAVVRYRRNGRVVKLYVIAVLMDNTQHAIPLKLGKKKQKE